MNEYQFAGVFDRIKAYAVDMGLIFISMIIFAQIFSSMGQVDSIYKIMVFVLLFFLYEPVMVGLVGSTLGHKAMGLKVVKENDDKPIGLFKAVIRFIVKVLLGWISLLTISGNSKKQAIHDLSVGSYVVLVKKPINS